MNYSKILISILSLVPVACSANIIHMQKWRHNETGQEVIMAGDCHVNGVHEKQAADLKALIDAGVVPIVEFREVASWQETNAPLLLLWLHRYCKEHAQNYVPAEIRPESYFQSLGINRLLYENQLLTEQVVQQAWQALGINFHRSRSALLEELRKFVPLIKAKKHSKEKFREYCSAIGAAYKALEEEASRLKALINPQFDDLPGEEYYRLFSELYRNNLILGEKDGQIMLNTKSLEYMLERAMYSLVELNFLFHLTEASASRVLVACGDEHVRNMQEKMVELGYGLEKTADSHHTFKESVKSLKDIYYQNIDEYCIDIAQFLAE